MIEVAPSRNPVLAAATRSETPGRRFHPKSTAIRLFVTCWLVYALHLATNTVREIYPALSLGDHFSFRVDEYAGLHPDLFDKPGYGWHINSNPGASMLGAIPYALARPVIDRVTARVNLGRAANPNLQPPAYDSPWPMARQFYAEAWKRGLDVKLGLAAIVTAAGCMAPIAAFGAVLMFGLLRRVLASEKAALWLTVLYAFGTPIFFRTGYLNQNALLAHAGLLAFAALWNPGGMWRMKASRRYLVAGAAAGMGVLLDYSGVVLLAALVAYGAIKAWQDAENAKRLVFQFAAGASGPLALLAFYQWRSFGNPLLPAQNWMPAVAFVNEGYRGMGWPAADMLWANLFDYRYGLLVSCPLLLLACGALWKKLRGLGIPKLEFWFLLGTPVALWLFASGVGYSRLQFNTGVRYLVPAVPLLYVLAAAVLARIPRRWAYFVGLAAVAQAWPMAMYRDVERGMGVLEPVAQVFLGGFRLPVLDVLSRTGGQYGDYFAHGASPLPLFLFAGLTIYGIWSVRFESGEPR